MPRQTQRMLWTIPSEGDDPWFDTFYAFAADLDADGYAEADNNNLIFTGSALFAWDLASSTLTWDAPFYFSGFTTPYRNRIAGPTGTAPIVSLGAAGNVDNGKHFYFVTFVDGLSVETPAGPSTYITVVDKLTNGQVNLTSVLTGPLGTVSRKIYRTEANAFTYKLVGTIPNNTATAFVDNIADAGLGAILAVTVPSQATILEGQVLAVQMPRLLTMTSTSTPYTAARIAESPGVKIHDLIVIAVRTNGNIYFRNGVTLQDGDSGPIWERPTIPGSSGLTSMQRTTINAALHTHDEIEFIQPGTPIGSTVLTCPTAAPETVQRVEVYRNGQRRRATVDYTVTLGAIATVTLTAPTIAGDYYVVVRQISKTVT